MTRPLGGFCVAFSYQRRFLRRAVRAFASPATLPIAKFSSFLPSFNCACSHRGLAPLPAHVSERFFGLRYLGGSFRPLKELLPLTAAGRPRRGMRLSTRASLPWRSARIVVTKLPI